ncbi:MAG: hypothetical protein IPG07_02630 [Crocinitomicaceae bacterium]|nr:hypothetical protein [Crocinitomicaceae bacterium]
MALKDPMLIPVLKKNVRRLKRERDFLLVPVGLAVIHQISGLSVVFIEWHTQFELTVLYFSPVVDGVFYRIFG